MSGLSVVGVSVDAAWKQTLEISRKPTACKSPAPRRRPAQSVLPPFSPPQTTKPHNILDA